MDKYKPGDSIVFNYYGVRTKFTFMHPLDIIDANTYYQTPCQGINPDEPMCYETTLSKFDKNDHIFQSTSVGDRICEGHMARIYMKKSTPEKYE